MAGFFSRLKEGLAKSTQKLTGGITAAFVHRKLDDAALEELEDLLIGADLGHPVARRIIRDFRRTRFGDEVTDQEIRQTLAAEIATILAPSHNPSSSKKPASPTSSSSPASTASQDHHNRQARPKF